MKYQNILEEELKNKIGQEYFPEFDSTKIIGKVDFCVTLKTPPSFESKIPSALGTSLERKNKVEIALSKGLHKVVGYLENITQSLLWAEAKKGKSDIVNSFVQLILTIGKARTFDRFLPPAFLGAFDSFNFAFLPYNDIQDVFYQNDFNWTVTPSNYETKEFKLLHSKVKSILQSNTLIFGFQTDDKELREFIKTNFVVGKSDTSRIQIDKNNFLSIYNKWLTAVKPSILVNWEMAQKVNIIDADFYLADLLSDHNQSLKETLFVLLKGDHYELDKTLDSVGFFSSKRTNFNDSQKAHTQFWNRYQRPPRAEYWDYIVERRDLLVPQDIRERKGSFFTPQIWVEKSQEYIQAVLGQDWQDDYFVWDCCAGTGNLLTGLTNRYNIYASTLDRQDVDVMHQRIDNGANLLHEHVFQFDFLNDDFSKCPKSLQDILNDPQQRKKLVIYINPPYAEVSSYGIKEKTGVNKSKSHEKYTEKLGTAGRELFTQFFARIYYEFDGCILAEFSTVKALQGAGFDKFREFFKAKLEKMFIVPGDTFDNVKGKFPIGFKIWNTDKKQQFREIKSDVYNLKNQLIGQKLFSSVPKNRYINNWINKYKIKEQDGIGFLAGTNGNDFQTCNIVYILNKKEQMANPRGVWVSDKNLIYACIYNAVRHCIKATWINDRDQFLCPDNLDWKTDIAFQNDCLTYTLFTNNISSKFGTNHWIPFREAEVNSRGRFESHFMTDYIAGKLTTTEETIFGVENIEQEFPLEFSQEAKAVFDAGRELWKYYHETPKIRNFDPLKVVNYNINASFYDIKTYFQGQNEVGRMNSKSKDEKYNELLKKLNQSLEILATTIEPKIYKYGFLLK